MTSLADLGIAATMGEVDAALRTRFEERFGATRTDDQPYRLQPVATGDF